MKPFLKRFSFGSNVMKKYQNNIYKDIFGIQEGTYFLIPTIKLVVKKNNFPASWVIEEGFPHKRFTIHVVFLSFHFWASFSI
jgi:hypothetical protein